MKLSTLSLVLLSAFASSTEAMRFKGAPAPQAGSVATPDCATNADCLKLGLPLLSPKRRQLQARNNLSPPQASAGPATRIDYTGGIQTFTAPSDGYYYIQAVGASGGAGSNNAYPGGLAALAEGSVYLTENTNVEIVVGGVGSRSVNNAGPGGGGGGTFLFVGSDPLVVAGGGGGARFSTPGLPGSVTTSGANGGGNFPGLGGTDGQGGTATAGGGGGAGFLSAGGTAGDGNNKGGQSAAGGWAGGLSNGDQYEAPGGYGGGGAGGYTNQGYLPGGGGGGYSGGGGGGTASSGPGGGGGSFVAGSYNGQSVQRTRTDVYDEFGNGFVLIRKA